MQNPHTPHRFCNGRRTVLRLILGLLAAADYWEVVLRPNAEVRMMSRVSTESKQAERSENVSQRSNKDANNGSIGRRLLNVGEAAQYLGVSVDTLHKWVQLRAIPHVKAGRALRFDLVALNRYIDEHTIGTID